MRNSASILLAVIIAVQFVQAPCALAYGYAEAEDPALAIFREGVAAARKGEFDKAGAKASEGLAIIKDHQRNGAALAPKAVEAARNKNAPALAEILANIVWLSTKEKLEANIADGLKNQAECKARLFLARKNYLDALDGNIKKSKPDDSAKIMALFDEALRALGNPGLFGMGAKPADLEAFKRAVAGIEQTVEGFFNRFEKR